MPSSSSPTTTLRPLRDAGLLRDRAYVDGAWTAAADSSVFAVEDPASGARVAEVANLGAADARAAADAAERALPAWRARTAAERAAAVRRWADLMHAERDALALLLSSEQGKPLAEARGEVDYAASFLTWFAEEAPRAYGQLVPAPRGEDRIVTMRQPVGVAVAITPWNFPLAMITRKAGAGLAAGCTLVVKPAEQTPLSALALAELAARAGIPAGALNVVTGDRTNAEAIGTALIEHPAVRKLSFTGSTAVGKLLAERCARRVVNVSLELGGNAPFLVFEDADLDAAVAGAIAAKFRNAGQTCICPNRLLVHDAVHDAFAERLAAAVAQLKVGPAEEPGAQIGPLIDERGVAKVERHVADARTRGAELLTGGERHPLGGGFYAPTVLTGVPADALMGREETFGPVAGIARFADEEEGIQLANATPSGLAAYVYTRDAGRMWRAAEQLETGMVGVNAGAISTAVAPFGGMKESGIGREGGASGIGEWLEEKYVCFGGVGAAGA
ncbi:MAG TPA: NAD-dependent succinate-semialdehyde dehydrogenase [Conexibacter sp.]|nr:NAD-dependent succinate-semialdehyde dehydrogenase [Conexibacter sp.]